MSDGKNGFEKTKHNFPYKWTLKDAVFTKDKRKLLRNCVTPTVGLHILNCAVGKKKRKKIIKNGTMIRSTAITAND